MTKTTRFPTAVLPLFLAILLALVAVACTPDASEESEATPPAERPDILLLTVDTLRADHLSSYGYPRRTSPTIDRLAAEGLRFERAAVQWPKTGPSFASIFTSTYPKDNGIVRQIGIPVPLEMTMLAERLSEAGYRTRAVVANGALSSEFHFDQGFDEYVQTWQTDAPEGVERDAARHVTDLALAQARALASDTEDAPYFLWVHYLDPHFPYTPPEPFRDHFQDDEHFGRLTGIVPGLEDGLIPVSERRPRKQMLGIGFDQILDGRRDHAFYVARYDAEIAFTDHQIDRLFDGLGELGLLRDALTVFTSDHGESLGEHHFWFDHGRFGFQTCLRVPLVFHHPGWIAPGVVNEPTALLDLSPTLLQYAGVEIAGDGTWQAGRSLLPRLRGERPTTGPAAVSTHGEIVFSEAGHAPEGRWQRIAQDRRFKLVLAPEEKAQIWMGGEGVPLVLYDLETDPAETKNVIEEHPQDAARLESALRRWLRSNPETVERAAEDESAMDEETREQLRALGYID